MVAPYNYITLNGSNQYVSIPRSIQDDFTIEIWFRSSQGISTSTDWWAGAGLVDGEVSGYTNDFGISLNANGQVLAGIGGSVSQYKSLPSQTGLNNGNWHHVAHTRNSSTGLTQLYIDGVLVNSATGITGSLTAPPKLTIGCIQNGGNYFGGDIGEIRLWNIVRTRNDINTSKNYLLNGNEYGLVAYYKSISGNSLIDSTTNSNNGTIFNTPTFTDNNATGTLAPVPIYHATLISPSNNSMIDNSLPTLTASYEDIGTVKNGELVNAIVEVDIVSNFNTTLKQSKTITNIADGSTFAYTPTTPIIDTYWCWRVTITSSDGSIRYKTQSNIFAVNNGNTATSLSQYENASFNYAIDRWTNTQTLYQYENASFNYTMDRWTNTEALSEYENVIQYQGTGRKYVLYI